MSALVSEIREQVTNEIGNKVEDALEVARREVYAFEGRQIAFLESSKLVDSITSFMNKDVADGKLTLEIAKEVSVYLNKIAHGLQQSSAQAVAQRTMAMGKVQGMEHAVKMLAGIAELEKAKRVRIEALNKAAENPGQEEVDPHAHRFLSIKEQRLAEEKRAEETPVAIDSSPVEPESIEEPTKRRGRKNRGSNA